MVDEARRISWFKQRKWRIALLVGIALLAVWGGLRWDRKRRALYRVTILPSLGGGVTNPCAINDRGQIVGLSRTADGAYHGFLWDREHGMEDLGGLGGCRDINNAGWIAGTISDPNVENGAFIRDPNGTLHFLGDLGGGKSAAVALNDRNQVAGTSVDANGVRHAFFWDQANGMRSIMEQDDRVEAINDAGQVLGYAETATQLCQPFLWDPNEGLLNIDTISESSTLTLHHHNCLLGQHLSVARGYCMVLWRQQTGIEELFPFDFDHGIDAAEVLINDANQVAYRECYPTRWERLGLPASRMERRQVLWDPKRGRIELDRYLPWRLRKSFVARDMNNQGGIVGYAPKGEKTLLAVLLEPIPEKWEK